MNTGKSIIKNCSIAGMGLAAGSLGYGIISGNSQLVSAGSATALATLGMNFCTSTILDMIKNRAEDKKRVADVSAKESQYLDTIFTSRNIYEVQDALFTLINDHSYSIDEICDRLGIDHRFLRRVYNNSSDIGYIELQEELTGSDEINKETTGQERNELDRLEYDLDRLYSLLSEKNARLQKQIFRMNSVKKEEDDEYKKEIDALNRDIEYADEQVNFIRNRMLEINYTIRRRYATNVVARHATMQNVMKMMG